MSGHIFNLVSKLFFIQDTRLTAGNQHNGQRLHLSSRPSRFEPGTFRLIQIKFYQHVITLSPPVHRLVYQRPCHVLSCLCDIAYKRSPAICHKSRASCPVSRLLSAPLWPACAKQGRKYDSINHDFKLDVFCILYHVPILNDYLLVAVGQTRNV